MLKAIETRYKGYRFRSRLEARWAVFLDTLNVSWMYEEQGFDLGDAGLYLPDFRFKSEGGAEVWFEVKPDDPTIEERYKAYQLAMQSEGLCLIGAGTPGQERIWLYAGHNKQRDIFEPSITDGYPVWCDLFILDRPICKARCPKTHDAYMAARSARFEHGERGDVR